MTQYSESHFVCTFIVLFCSIYSQCNARCTPHQIDDIESIPLPPSLLPLPRLKLMGFNDEQLVLNCELLVCTIPTPITYKWFHSEEREGQCEELTNEDGLYHISGSDLYIDGSINNIRTWDEVPGFYWCEAENEKGVATSNKVQVEASKPITTKEPLPKTIIQLGQSVHLKMDRDSVTDDDVPVNVHYDLNFGLDAGRGMIFKPRDEIDGKEGRFVIGDDYDLYVLEANGSDSSTFKQRQTYYSTSTKLDYRQPSELYVEDVTSSHIYRNLSLPSETGFFDGYTDYVFVEGEPSHFTCIPKKVRKVTFKKDGKEIEDLTENEDEDVFRSRYGLWFKKAHASHAGTYTCHLEGDSAILTKTVKVVGPPQINCDFENFVIETPGNPISMSCDVTSNFHSVNEPELYFNNQPFDDAKSANKRISFEKTVNKIEGGYRLQVSAKETNEEADTGVFRFSEKADQATTRREVLEKLGYLEFQFDRVHFNGFRLLPFENRVEVVVAVLEMPLRIKWNSHQNLNPSLGEKDFSVVAFIYGSPMPEVSWFVDGKLIGENDLNYHSDVKYTAIFEFFIHEVQQSYNVTVKGQHTLDGKVNTVTHDFIIEAHQH